MLNGVRGFERGTRFVQVKWYDWDGAWVLTSGTHQGDPLGLLDSHPVTLVLDGDDVNGISACNHYGGTVTRSGDSITFEAMSMTEMACSPESAMALDGGGSSTLNWREGDRLETFVAGGKPPAAVNSALLVLP